LPSVTTPEDDLRVLPPTRTYSKTLVPSAVTPIPIHADSPSASFQMSAVQPSSTVANTFAMKETFFPLSSVNVNASNRELRHINCQSSSSKPLFGTELVNMYILQIFNVHYIPSVVLLFWSYYSVQYGTCEHKYSYISEFQGSLYFFSYFIILAILFCSVLKL
jgi:hypothetical protein